MALACSIFERRGPFLFHRLTQKRILARMGPLNELQNEAVTALREYKRTRGTECLRTVASTFVAAREHFYTRDGAPDWLGATHAYRQWTREAYDRAGTPEAELSRLQASVRYHVGNIMREKLDPDEVADLGLREASPRERAVEKRERTSETLNLFGGGYPITEPGEALTALSVLEVTLRRIMPDAVRSSAEAHDKLLEIAGRTKFLSRAAGASIAAADVASAE